MKKIILILIIIISFFIIKNYNEEVIIPSEAIRFRVIANSNSEIDQNIKKKVRTNLEKSIISKMDNIDDVNKAEVILKKSIPELENIVEKTLIENNYNNKYNVNFGYNYFPEKKYKGVTYKEGKYKSLVVTLGSGKGDNWWCVLFPPLCLVEAEETEETDDIEYRFFIKDLIDKYF